MKSFLAVFLVLQSEIANSAATGGSTGAVFIDPIMDKAILIEDGSQKSYLGYSLTFDYGAADNYKTPDINREIHVNLKLKTLNPPDHKIFYFGFLFSPLAIPTETTTASSHHRVLAANTTIKNATATNSTTNITIKASTNTAVSDQKTTSDHSTTTDCHIDTTNGTRWDGVAVNYMYSKVPDASTHFEVEDLWYLGETPDPAHNGALSDYL